ncbi:hypothetical protein MSG28_015343 [Choristoneura fumiferana]|uniref:Uncharacterized protein n=1 Tax=Choristoneura fumiferana TaxID=7141 RepID=A0ACC0KA54_CHOFU|nr:hypothetical protein MSG28_015343 [Choristoneura fumiferana]
MPYYCTVPRCTSMAGKAKNVSFHQFPRDEELAKLWNRVLKRGKPYTKYSKVCSLHFKPEDYTITSVGKNKEPAGRGAGPVPPPVQHRVGAKLAEPLSYKMPYYCTVPRCTSMAGKAKNVSFHQFPRDEELAKLWNRVLKRGKPYTKYSKVCSLHFKPEDYTITSVGKNKDQPVQPEPDPSPSGSSLSEIELLLRCKPDEQREETYQCQECSKCFKDPDVLILHKRLHTRDKPNSIEKENYSANIQDREETLRANPILANLLKSSMRLEPEGNMLDASVLTVENQIMNALASNMEAYIRTLSSMLSSQGSIHNVGDRLDNEDHHSEDGENRSLDKNAPCEDAMEDDVSNSCKDNI